MKRIFILSILCLVAVQRAWARELSLQQPIARVIIMECVKEFDVDVTKIDNVNNKDATCLFACGLRKWSNRKGLTLTEGLVKMIDEVYEAGFQSSRFTSADAILKVGQCSIKESDECEFARCVQIFSPPFIDVYLYYIANYKPTSTFKL